MKLAMVYVLAVCCSSVVFSMSDCKSELAEAENRYQRGYFNEAVTLIETCLNKPGVSKSERMSGYRLMGLIYIAKDFASQAQESIRKLLELVPNYETNPDMDPPHFREMVAEIKQEQAQRKRQEGSPPVPSTATEFESRHPKPPAATGFGGLGAMLGINSSNFGGSDDEGQEPLRGATIGGFLKFHLNRNLAIQPELTLSGKGSDFEAANGQIFRERLIYLEIPVLAVVEIEPIGGIVPRFFAGPAFAFKLSETSQDIINGEVINEDDTENFKGSDVGITLGVGGALPLGSGEIQGSIRFTSGLSNVDDSGFDLDLKNRVASIMVGYIFTPN